MAATLCGGCHLRLANVEPSRLEGYLRKPNKLGVIFNSASDLPAIGPHLLLLQNRLLYMPNINYLYRLQCVDKVLVHNKII